LTRASAPLYSNERRQGRHCAHGSTTRRQTLDFTPKRRGVPDFVDTSEEGGRRSLAVFAKWQPPAGAEFKGFYGCADGKGGVAIIEADSAATLARTTAPWTPWLRFTVTPIVPIEESTAINGEAVAFRDSVA
jgi:hypothetical protein